MQVATVKNIYGKLELAFKNYQNILKRVYEQQHVSARPKRQATIVDVS